MVKKEIANDILLTEEPYFSVAIPSIDCILGDKLTAFAPHTTGIPFDVKKEMEIIKQMFDVATLIEECNDFQDIYESYMKTVESEIAYRDNGCTAEEALVDTIEMAAIQACSVMYMAACILKNKEFVKIEKPEDYLKDSISKSKYKNLAYIKKLKLEAYGYLVEAVRLLEERE